MQATKPIVMENLWFTSRLAAMSFMTTTNVINEKNV